MAASASARFEKLTKPMPRQAPVSSSRITRTQGLTPVHYSAQLEPCLTHKNTLHTLNNPQQPLDTGYTIPTRTPYPINSAQVELKSG